MKGMAMLFDPPEGATIFTKFRPDGWPLCPQCGEDGIAPQSFAILNAESESPTLQASFQAHCHKCGWTIEAEAKR